MSNARISAVERTSPAATLTNAIRIAPGFDERDNNGKFIGMGLCFDVEGWEGRLTWSINTGWAPRPVTTQRLTSGPQKRASTPGVDHMIATHFPQPMSLGLVPLGATHLRVVDASSADFLDLLITQGQDVIFERLEDIYRAIFPSPSYAATPPTSKDDIENHDDARA